MMDFEYVATGWGHPGGSAEVKVEYFYFVRFAVGAIAYDCRAASSKGRIEPVVIKKYKIIYNPYDVLYTDTLNALWNEDQLCSHSEAVNFAISYYERQQALAESMMDMD